MFDNQEDYWGTPSDDGINMQTAQQGFDTEESDTDNSNFFADFSDTTNDSFFSNQESSYVPNSRNQEQQQYNGTQGTVYQEQSSEQFSQESIPPKKEFKLGYGIAGVVIGVGFVLLFIITTFFSNLSLKPKVKVVNNNAGNTQVVKQAEQSGTQQTVQTEPINTTSVQQEVLIKIPESTEMNYSDDLLSATGIVTGKQKYLMGNQVVYCVTIGLTLGDSQQIVNYFCNYVSYNAVGLNDIVQVDYQQVSDKCFSVTQVLKK